MKKNIANLLQKGNLTPKERSLMIVHNHVTENREGRGFLSEADKYSLVEGWQPKDNHEVREFNKYNGAWRSSLYAEIDAQTTFLSAQNAFLRADLVASYYMFSNYEDALERKSRFFDWVNMDADKHPNGRDVLNVVLENSGLGREYVEYRYAFELIEEELKRDLLRLYPDIETESDYLKAEFVLYELLGEKGEASPEAKDKIADLIAERTFNKYRAALIEQTEKNGKTPPDASPWSFSGYFADIPLIEVAKKWAEYNKIPLPDEEEQDESALEKILIEKITAHAQGRKTDIGTLIKQAARQWLDEGLLEDYAPLFLSDRQGTVNGKDTTLPHKEVFKQWLAVKAKAEQEIRSMIDRGKLQVR
jgi:hypothetical protein